MNVKRMFVKVLAGSVLVTGMWGDVLLAQGQETTLPEPAAVAATEPVPVSKKQQKLAAKLAAEIAKLEATEKELIAESIGTGMAIPKGLKDELQKTYAGADTAIKAMAAALPPEELRSIRQYRETVRWIRHLVGDLSERYEHLDDLLDDDDLPEDNKLIAGMRKNLTALAAKITEALKAWNEGDRLKGLKARAEARVLMVQSEQQMESMEFEFWFTELRGFAEQHPGDANVTAAFKVLEAEYKRVAELRAARQTMILKMVALESQQEILDLQMDELDKRLGEMEEQEDAGHEQFEAAAEIMEEQIERLEEDDEDHDDGEEDDDDGEEDDDDGEEAPAPEEDVF